MIWADGDVTWTGFTNRAAPSHWRPPSRLASLSRRHVGVRPGLGGVEPDRGLIGPHLGDTAGNVRRGIAAREVARRESWAGRAAKSKAVHRKRPPRGAIAIPCHQVPTPL